MYSYSSALKTIVERQVTQAHLSDSVSVEPTEFERRIYGALNELFQTRPRIVEFAPRIALTRALHRDHANTSVPPKSSGDREVSAVAPGPWRP
jgi:hypothetical protein